MSALVPARAQTLNAYELAVSQFRAHVVQIEASRRPVEDAARAGLFYEIFPDTGPLRRELYVKHMAFFRAGAKHHERLALCANQIGKTWMAAFEVTAHLTGEYPHWWEGFRFTHPITAWAAGDTMQTTRDIIQTVLLGPIEGVPTQDWSGMIPRRFIHHTTRKGGGVPYCIDQMWVQHVSGGLSTLGIKSFDQGRRAFQGTKREMIWLDEEPPPQPVDAVSGDANDIYTECLLRTVNSGGIMMTTFTPLSGLTRFIVDYLETSVTDGTDGEVPARELLNPPAVVAEVVEDPKRRLKATA